MEETVKASHVMRDGFPGMARLIDASHHVVAVNLAAETRVHFSERSFAMPLNLQG